MYHNSYILSTPFLNFSRFFFVCKKPSESLHFSRHSKEAALYRSSRYICAQLIQKTPLKQSRNASYSLRGMQRGQGRHITHSLSLRRPFLEPPSVGLSISHWWHAPEAPLPGDRPCLPVPLRSGTIPSWESATAAVPFFPDNHGRPGRRHLSKKPCHTAPEPAVPFP